MKILMDNPNIFMYATSNTEAIGGAERQQWLLARALAKSGHEVVVYSRFDSEKTNEVIEGVTFKWISISNPLLAWPKILSQEKADWWYWRCNSFYLGVLVPMAHFYSTKVVFACAFDTDCTPCHALTRRTYMWPLYLSGLISADRILVQHSGQKELLPKFLQHKASLVPSIAGVETVVPEREDYVAWIGVLRETKQPHLLMEIANRLPHVRFVVCGPTSLHRTKPEYAKNIILQLRSCSNIEYKGQVSPDEAQRVISRSALILSTARAEGFPNTFLQAWGSAVPVVSLGLDPGGIISRDSAGIVVKDINELSKVIPLLLNDKAYNRELGMNGYRYVQQIHNERSAINKFLSVISTSN